MQGTVKFGAIVGVGVLAVSAVALAKRDKAAEPLGMCVEAFNAGRLGDARSGCDRAIAVDPDSAAGRKAREQRALIDLKQAALDKQAERDEEVRREARKEEEATTKRREAQEAACSKWTTICTLGRFPDGSERTTGAQRFSTKSACEGAGASLGVRCDPCRCID